MTKRIYFFWGILLVGLMILAAKTAQLQLIFGQQNREIADGNRIKKVILPAPRGIIYDRKGRPLVRNIPIYRRQNEKCVPTCFEEISREEALRLEARGGEEAKNLRVDVGREYIWGPALAHLLGYLGEANKEEVEAGRYRLGDLVGRGGVEEKYDNWLRGKDGGEVFEINSLGEKIREIGIQPPQPGKDLYLTIDAELSRVAFVALSGEKGRPGAVVATEAKTGRVLVLVSSPSFNPEKITPSLLTDNRRPMFNRAIAGLYPPGSTFKIVTAAAGLEEGKITAETLWEDTGEIRVGNYVYKNWYFSQYGKTEGKIDVVRALARSTDTFFYKVGEWVGPTKLAYWAAAFGLGKPTGIDLPGEASGKIPQPDKEKWFLGNTYHFAIGQGDLLVTPLQINMMTSVIANEGKLCRPKINQKTKIKNQKELDGQDTSDGGRGNPPAGEETSGSSEVGDCQDLHLKAETLRLIKEGMKKTCSPGGTAFPFFDFSPPVACKTGTAEFGDPQNRTHAWLTAFAPADDPQIVVTALVEAGGEGSYVAAPIVKKVMEEWFRK